jgi:quercetin dioxygenase-like cupin family protein
MKAKMLGLGLAGALAVAVPAFGGSPPIFAKAIAVGTMKAATIQTKGGAMVLDSITIAPGGNFGWHTHGAPVAVVVTHGTLTVFDPSVANCAPFKVSKGASFVEPANHVHLARNDGKTQVRLYAMFLGVPKGAGANIPAKEPAGCDA